MSLTGSGNGAEALRDEEWVLHHYRLALSALRTICDSRSVDVFDQLVSGRSVGEVAEMFSITPEAVRKTKQRLRDRLRSIVAAQIDDEECCDGR